MNFQQLDYIVALDRYKNFSKAAESCAITQATLSTMVKKLEEELGLILFDRKRSPILTTDEGKIIIEEAKKLLSLSHRLKNIHSERKGIIEGEIRIGVIPTVASNLLHRIIPSILAKYPLLKLSIEEIPTESIVHKLKMGEIDAGILSTPLKSDDLEEVILYYEKLMVYGKTIHSDTRFLRPKDLLDERVWLLEQGNCLADQIVNLCALSPKKINTNLQFNPNSFDSLLNIVDSMDGLTFIPELYFMDLPEDRKMKVKEFNSPYPVREISMVFHRPFAKSKMIDLISKDIKGLIQPILQTRFLKNSEMIIADF